MTNPYIKPVLAKLAKLYKGLVTQDQVRTCGWNLGYSVTTDETTYTITDKYTGRNVQKGLLITC